jgi:hypothetical protein
MSKVVVVDQLTVHGNIDIDYSPDNAMALLSILGELGFSPTTFSELDKESSQVENRLGFIKDQFKINFHPNKIIIGNAPDPSKELITNFNELALEILSRIFSKFPGVLVSHLIRSGDYFAPEMNAKKMGRLRGKFFQDAESEPVEWRARQTFANEQHGDVIFFTIETGRAQGHLNIQGSKTAFDRIRYKVMVQTDVASRSFNHDAASTLQWAAIIMAEHSRRLDEAESSLNE